MSMYINVQVSFLRAETISLSVANYEPARKQTEKCNGFIGHLDG